MQFPKKAAALFRKLSYAVKKIFAAVRSGTEKAVLVKEFVFGEECLGFVCVVRDNVLHLWRHIKPKLLKIDMTIGFDDPAVTGQVLGIIAAFCGAAGIMPCVTPDFEKRVFESDIEIKGRHDPIIGPRAVVVVESMCAITLLDLIIANASAKIDNLKKIYI